ncbi:MAG: hypothetical protein HZA93_29685 [Verrucomicrobia bacterium]|nr:hypothetical protein [Verrucomicrobiota bacterium]
MKSVAGLTFLLVLHCALCAAEPARLELAGLFRDGVVLQREKPVPVWGWARAGQAVTVSFLDQRHETRADSAGAWRVDLAPLRAGGPHVLEIRAPGENPLAIRDVMVGEVWLLSGQSNMGGPLLSSLGGVEAARGANSPLVRLGFVHAAGPAPTGQKLQPVAWVNAISGGNPDAMQRWHGIHFAFGTLLHERLGVAVGLIGANRGGTRISAWTSRATHEREPAFRGVLAASAETRTKAGRTHAARRADEVAAWTKLRDAALAAGKTPPPPPAPKELAANPNEAAIQYDTLIDPVAPFAIRGVLWYQGESDSPQAELYEARFRAFVADWRERWREPELPFICAQIAFSAGSPRPGIARDGPPIPSPSASIRQAQFAARTVPHTGLIVTHDLVRPEDDVHFRDKLPVGRRFALTALHVVYGQPGEASGPLFRRAEFAAGRARLHFDHATGLATTGGDLHGFSIAGADRRWVWANARIDGDEVVVWSDAVPTPVAVRYNWSDFPLGANLVNAAGLPAPTFRTDDWPLEHR